MSKKLLNIVLMIVLIMSAGCSILENDSGNEEEIIDLFPVVVDGDAGFIDDRGRIVIAPSREFSSPTVFHYNRAVVRTADGFRVINEKGEFITNQLFDRVQAFSEGLALVHYANRVGYINRDGKVVIPIQYFSATPFKNGRAVVWKGNNEIVLITPEGHEISAPDSTHIMESVYGFKQPGMFLIRKNLKFGFMNQDGEIVIEPEFDSAGSFSSNRACVRKDEEWGWIDTEGNWAVKFGERRCEDLIDNRAFLRDSLGFYALIDQYGNQLTDYKFSRVFPFSGNRAIVKENDLETMLIDKEGNVIFEGEFDLGYHEYGEYFINGLLQIRERLSFGVRGMGYIDTTGSYIWYPTY